MRRLNRHDGITCRKIDDLSTYRVNVSIESTMSAIKSIFRRFFDMSRVYVDFFDRLVTCVEEKAKFRPKRQNALHPPVLAAMESHPDREPLRIR